VAIALLAWPVYAAEKPNDAQQERQRKAVEDAYKAALERSKITTPKRTVDPWGVVREPDPAPKKSDPVAGDAKPGHP